MGSQAQAMHDPGMPPAAQSAPLDQWMSTAGESAQPSLPAQTPPVPPGGAAPQQPAKGAGSTTSGNAAAAGAGAKAPAAAAPATVITPLKRGGLLGVMDSVADALAGKQRPELAKDQEGNLYVKQVSLTRGQQWMRIAGEAITGAAAGLAAGRGAGNMGKAAEAGVQNGMQLRQQQKQDEQEMNEQVDKQKLANANNQMLQMKMAQMSWQMQRDQVRAGEEDAQFYQGFEDRLTKAGGTLIGTAAHAGDIADILKVQPDVFEQMIKRQTVKILPNVGEDGQVHGIKAYLMPASYQQTILPAGAVGHHFNPATGQIEEFRYADPVSQGERDANDAAAATALMEFQTKKAALDKSAAETAEANANAAAKPAEAAAQTAHERAEANEANVRARKEQQDLTETGPDSALVDEIGTGKIPAGGRGGLGYLLARNPDLIKAVAQKYPDFDASKVASYADTYKQFTEGKVAQQLVSGGTALEHLQELSALNTTASHIRGTPAWHAYHNKANQVATELAGFYGDNNIPAVQRYLDGLMAVVPGTRQREIATQAQSMGDRLDSYVTQWTNAAPSKAYEAQMPNISVNAQLARARLDPNYAKRLGRAPGADGKTHLVDLQDHRDLGALP